MRLADGSRVPDARKPDVCTSRSGRTAAPKVGVLRLLVLVIDKRVSYSETIDEQTVRRTQCLSV